MKQDLLDDLVVVVGAHLLGHIGEGAEINAINLFLELLNSGFLIMGLNYEKLLQAQDES